jgi:NADPH:quinone reductase-like Zn-dependent oxidoreductase
LPRGLGLDVAGVVDAIGEDVSDVAIGDRVFGTADFAGSPSAGAADRAILDRWSRIPAGLDFVKAGALPLSVETAHRSVDQLDVKAGQTFLVHGAGTTVGFAAVQIALLRGARVIATAGATNAQPLRTFGAEVTSYGEGMVERVLAIAKKPVDLILDTAPPSSALPDLVTIAGGDPRRVLTVSDLAGAAAAGVRTTFGEANVKLRYDVLPDFAQRAADGKFSIPIAKTFPLEDWRAAMDLSLGGHARGKIMLLPTEG